MKRRKTYFFIALLLTVTVVLLLVTGSSLLTLALDSDKSIPLGTFITWIGMISLPLTIYWGIKELRIPSRKVTKLLSILLKIIIVLGILWIPISYGLAGNISFTFSEKATFQGGQTAMKWFWYLTHGIGVGTLLTLVSYWISLLFYKK